MPIAWIVRAPSTQPALFLDLGQALAYVGKTNGQMGALYEGPLPKDLPAQPVLQRE